MIICVLGKLRHSKYKDKKGEMRYSTQVAADELTYLGSKGDPVIPERPKKDEDESEEYKE
jgi:single-stranded DNA-binding protein